MILKTTPTWKAMTEPIGELYKMLVLDANEHDPEGEALKKAGKKIQEALTEYFNETRGQSFPLNESKLFGKKFNERTAMTAKEAEKQLRAIGDNDPDSIIWILGDILRGIAENCDETVANDIVNSVNEPKLAQLTMAIFQDIWDGRLNDEDEYTFE